MPCTDYIADQQAEVERWEKLTSENRLMQDALMGIFTDHPEVLAEQSGTVRAWAKHVQAEANRNAARVAKEQKQLATKRAARKKLLSALSPAELKALDIQVSDDDDI